MATKVAEHLFNINNIKSGKKVFQLCPKFRDFMIVNGEKNEALRNHPCSIHLPIIQLPDKLDRTAIKYLRDNVLERPKVLAKQAVNLRNALWSRMLLIEKNLAEYIRKNVQQKTVMQPPMLMPDEVMRHIDESSDPNIEELIIENASTVMRMHKTDVENRVKKEMIELAVPIRYSQHLSDLYLVSRLAPNFAACCRVLYEIRKKCPRFSPGNLFDFGSGIGSAVWAANSVWPIGTIKQHFLVDASTNMLSISEYLLKEGAIKQHVTAFPTVTHRSYLSSTNETLYDLVISCYSLLDITGGYLNRRDILLNLWKKTEKFLILVELGTKAGFAAILEARDWLVDTTKDDEQPAQIFAPCPHSMACPKSDSACNFIVRYEELRLTQTDSKVKSEQFSYIILHKGDISQYQDENEKILRTYPRIVSYKTRGPVQDLCVNDGTVTRYHMESDDKILRRYVNRCKAGDLMPVVPLDQHERND